MAVVVRSGTLVGVDGEAVAVEVDLLRRLPAVVVVGLASAAVRESADRVRSAIQEARFDFPKMRVVVNLAPADLRKDGSAFDLPIAVGVLAASGQVPTEKLADTAFFGELSLEGHLRGLRGALPLTLMAAQQGCSRVVLPIDALPQAAVVPGVEVLGAADLGQVSAWLCGKGELQREAIPPMVVAESGAAGIDLAAVRGQHRARRALEVAAAGGHNLLMIGSPGCGKTMLAARLPTILPSLTFAEALDITRVHSVAGLIPAGAGLVSQRPFRAPHHSVSAAGLIGGANLLPGEVSLAHHGVLFLDELPEFQRHVLELLRGPLEDRQIRLSRLQGSVTLPASISLIAAANPCPCGFAGHPARACTCASPALERYRARLSGPLLDRLDLQVWVQPVETNHLVRGQPGESSAAVRVRVDAARARQRARYGATHPLNNAELQGDQIREAADPSPEAVRALERTIDAHGLSGRAWARILKVARTIADLDGAARVEPVHVHEASAYRVPGVGANP
jgi:magnesium chelatase family protein